MDKRLLLSGILLTFGAITIRILCNTSLVCVQEFFSLYSMTLLGSFGIGFFIAGIFAKERFYYHYYAPIL